MPQDLEVYSAIDDEGNGYNLVSYSPVIGYTEYDIRGYTDSVFFEDNKEDMLFDISEYKQIVVL